jgi:glutamate decarboxylase
MNKSAGLIGLGTNSIVCIKADKSNGKMLTDDLEKAIVQTIADGKTPFFVNATAGTTVLSAFDDVEKIADICEKYGIWLNVDVRDHVFQLKKQIPSISYFYQAIWGGPVALSPNYSHLMKGCIRADSITFAPQKLLSVTLQCSFVLVKDKVVADKCLSANADYLFSSNKCYDVSYDIGDKKFQCGAKVNNGFLKK